MPKAASSPTATPDAAAEGRWTIARQWRLAWRALTWAALGALVIAALLVVGQIYLFYGLFADIHPLLGVGFVLAATAGFGWLVILPAARLMAMPAVIRPPDLDLSGADLTPEDITRRLRFDVAYLRALRRNPELADRRAEVEAALEAAHDLPQDARALSAFEHDRIEPLLAPLDRKVDGFIHAEASTVGATTAISMNGSLDAFFVLWRNVNMVSRIAHLYYGRPSLRGTAVILRDVAGAVILSRALDDVSDLAGEALGGVLGKLGGLVAGPLMDGSVNALVTLKIGYLAKRRCRSFAAWSPKRRAHVVVEVFNQVKAESASITGELLKRCEALGAAAASAGAKALSTPRSAWARVQSLIVRRPPAEGGAPETEER